MDQMVQRGEQVRLCSHDTTARHISGYPTIRPHLGKGLGSFQARLERQYRIGTATDKKKLKSLLNSGITLEFWDSTGLMLTSATRITQEAGPSSLPATTQMADVSTSSTSDASIPDADAGSSSLPAMPHSAVESANPTNLPTRTHMVDASTNTLDAAGFNDDSNPKGSSDVLPGLSTVLPTVKISLTLLATLFRWFSQFPLRRQLECARSYGRCLS